MGRKSTFTRSPPRRETAEREADQQRADGSRRRRVRLGRRAGLRRGAGSARRRRVSGLLSELVLLPGHVALEVLDALLRSTLDVGLGAERGGGVAELLARLLDVAPELLRRGLVVALLGRYRAEVARVFTHCTSSFVESRAASGTGGVAAATFFLPLRARIPATAP